MSSPDLHAEIAGAGLSGLSLAAHLAVEGWQDRRVLIMDDEATTSAAVSWGFWSARPGLLEPAVSKEVGRRSVSPLGLLPE